mmetsp:Transcript_77964/g.226183  ORF Transcript_77964/g.226183 Transcript_77964/m.226183 type:complete len:241 (-) Transcript_77964:639-1361(-)
MPMAAAARAPAVTARPSATNRNAERITASQSWGLKRVGLRSRSGWPSSELIAASAHAATSPTKGSGRQTKSAKRAATKSTAAKERIAMPSKVAGAAFEASAMTLTLTALAQRIHPKCTANGARSSQYSSLVMLTLSTLSAMPAKLASNKSIKTTDSQMTSCANAKVQPHWKTHTANHQGTETRTVSEARYRGSMSAKIAVASPVKMSPQMLNAQLAGVTKVWYLELRSLFVSPNTPVMET